MDTLEYSEAKVGEDAIGDIDEDLLDSASYSASPSPNQ